MTRQLALSVSATVIASLLITAVQHEFRALAPASKPDLTDSGKFAARVESLRVTADDALPAIALPVVPLLAADWVQPAPLAFDQADATAGTKLAADAPRAVRHAVRVEPHRRVVAEAGHDVLPPRRGDTLAETPTPSAAATTDDPGIWSSTKGVYREAVTLGTTVIDRVNPLNLIP